MPTSSRFQPGVLVAGLLAALSLLSWTQPVSAAGPVPAEGPARSRVEVVFCLDTTGSMGGLIEGAKQKIWAICNQIAGGKPTPDLKVGLVAYRDRGDEYITKVFDLTSDLDAVHAELKKYVANGGGDYPESVNQALADSVNKIKWSTDKKTMRIIFLVGDAPPHMDYPDDVKYPVTCKKAVERGIIINTIQCGGEAECTRIWKDIAARAEGAYAAIPQEGGVVAVATPYDARLAELNSELTKTALAYGGSARRRLALMRATDGLGLEARDAAERVAFGAKSGKVLEGDLLDDLKEKKADLKKIKEEELPDELKKLKTEKERKEYLEKIEKKRAELNKEVLDLDRKRADFVAKELAKKGKGKDSFDAQTFDILRRQAKKYSIAY